MKKGLLKALCITALVAVTGVGGLALGAEISNGFETSYSEEAYTNHGDEQLQIGFDQGKEEGLEIGFENGYTAGEDAGYTQGKNDGLEEGYQSGQQAGYDEGFNAGQNVGYENGYNAGESAGYDNGFEAGQNYKDPEKTYLEDIINGVALNIYKTENYTFLSGTDFSFKGLYKLKTDGSVEQIYNEGYVWQYFHELSNGNVLISSGATGNGIILYNATTNEVSQIYSSTYNIWQYFHELSNGNVLIGCDGQSDYGILLYNATTNEVSQIYTLGSFWRYFYELSNGNVLIASSWNDSSSHGILLLDVNTNEAEKIYTSGRWWDTFVPDENGVTISSSVNTDQGSVYYDYATGSVTPIEEVA